MSIEEDYMRALQQFRRQKDEYFRTEPGAPIPENEQATFKGLKYFPPFFALRFVAPVELLPAGDVVTMATTDGQSRQFTRYATLMFTVENQPSQLTAYRAVNVDAEADDNEDGAEADAGDAEHQSLFIPFRDALAGTQTYGAGRYLDVEEEHTEPGGHGGAFVILDFNMAYNPYCAYNDAYSCPVTPAENTLTVAIRAGERVYHEE